MGDPRPCQRQSQCETCREPRIQSIIHVGDWASKSRAVLHRHSPALFLHRERALCAQSETCAVLAQPAESLRRRSWHKKNGLHNLVRGLMVAPMACRHSDEPKLCVGQLGSNGHAPPRRKILHVFAVSVQPQKTKRCSSLGHRSE